MYLWKAATARRLLLKVPLVQAHAWFLQLVVVNSLPSGRDDTDVIVTFVPVNAHSQLGTLN